MCLLILEIGMLVMGILALVRGKIGLTPNRYVYGLPARIIGVILMLPLPLAFGGGLILGIILAAQGKPVDPKNLESTAAIMAISILVAVGLAVVIIGALTAKPLPPKVQRPPADEENPPAGNHPNQH